MTSSSAAWPRGPDDGWSDVEGIEEHFLAEGKAHLILPFRDDLRASLGLIGNHPLLRPETHWGARHEVTKQFKYHVWFRVLEEIAQVEILAVLHEARGDGVLAERL